MVVLDSAGHLAYMLIGAGMLLLGVRDPRGFLLQAMGSILWLTCGFFMRDAGTPIIVWNTVFAIIAVIGYRRLSRNGS